MVRHWYTLISMSEVSRVLMMSPWYELFSILQIANKLSNFFDKKIPKGLN